ncbi:MAG: malic enzyme-like NAD(P)-binding protein [Deltaproteobacteria bacterium]|nr:malic enzyme-like NAD(P)-binding protein [Deltaproteobacteria bacterium]
MLYRQKLVRTLRCKNKNVRGTLASLIATLSKAGADIGEISTVSVGELHNVRDISIIVNDEAELKNVIKAARAIPDVEVEQVIDDVLELHQHGKLTIQPTFPVYSIEDLRKVYTPGVASVCRLIQKDPKAARIYTSIAKTVALVTNGSRVLGLGNIGPVAAMPVMEGKAALFAQFTGLNMIPILINTLDIDEFVKTVEKISATFAAIQLEDIQTPDCFEIEEQLQKLPLPVMHDDQHGTAVVSLAAAINACKMAELDIHEATIGQIGLGAAGSAIARLMMRYTGKAVIGFDLKEESLARHKKFGGKTASLEELMKKANVVISTTGQAGLIKPTLVRKGQVILALSNPNPEISIVDALKAGASFASDGAQVNNLIGYPGIWKGVLDAGAKKITPEMYIAAAEAIAHSAPDKELVPSPLDPHVHDNVAHAVAKAATASGVASIPLDKDYFGETDGF